MNNYEKDWQNLLKKLKNLLCSLSYYCRCNCVTLPSPSPPGFVVINPEVAWPAARAAGEVAWIGRGPLVWQRRRHQALPGPGHYRVSGDKSGLCHNLILTAVYQGDICNLPLGFDKHSPPSNLCWIRTWHSTPHICRQLVNSLLICDRCLKKLFVVNIRHGLHDNTVH